MHVCICAQGGVRHFDLAVRKVCVPLMCAHDAAPMHKVHQVLHRLRKAQRDRPHRSKPLCFAQAGVEITVVTDWGCSFLTHHSDCVQQFFFESGGLMHRWRIRLRPLHVRAGMH